MLGSRAASHEEGRECVWQSLRLGLLEYERNPAKHIFTRVYWELFVSMFMFSV